MIFVCYDPFMVEGGKLYLIENNEVMDNCTSYSSISDLAKTTIKFCHLHDDYNVLFKPEFAFDTKEFMDAISCYEMIKYNKNKINVKEFKEKETE